MSKQFTTSSHPQAKSTLVIRLMDFSPPQKEGGISTYRTTLARNILAFKLVHGSDDSQEITYAILCPHDAVQQSYSQPKWFSKNISGLL